MRRASLIQQSEVTNATNLETTGARSGSAQLPEAEGNAGEPVLTYCARHNTNAVKHRKQSFVPPQLRLAQQQRHLRPATFKPHPSVYSAQQRARTQKQQHTVKAERKLKRLQEEHQRYRKAHTRQVILDAEGERIYIGDRGKALTQGRSHTDLGIVNRFSKDGSRVFFLDFRGVEQRRAPDNLVIVDQHE